MSLPTHLELLNPTLQALHALGGSASIEELAAHVADQLRLPQAVVEELHGHGNQTKLEYRLAWARSYLKMYGLVTNSERGVWALTPEGTKTQVVNPKEVGKQIRQKFQKRKRAEVDSGEEVDDEQGNPPSWRETLLETLLEMAPDGFERLCQRLLRESGFIEVEVTGRSGDGGIDGHGIIRVAGLISFTVLFQSKRHRGNLPPNVVRDFRGAMIGRADKGLIITTGGFTREARSEATRDGAPPIDLINGDLLVEKLRDLRLGVRTKMVEVVEVDTDWFKAI